MATSKDRRTVVDRLLLGAVQGREPYTLRGIAQDVLPYLLERLRPAALAPLFGRTVHAVRRWHDVKGCPRNADTTYCLRDVIAWWFEEGVKRGQGEDASGDALEEFRRERVRQLRRVNELEEGKVLFADDAMEWLVAAGDALRREFEAIGKIHGDEVAGEIREAVERFEKSMREKFDAGDD